MQQAMQQEPGAPPHDALPGSGSSSDGSSVNGSSVGDDDSRRPKRARLGDAPAGAGAAASSAHGDAAAPADANVVNNDGDDDDAASVHADDVDFDGGGSSGGGSSPASDRSDTATGELSSHGAAHGGDGSPGGGSSSSSSSSSSSTSSGGAAAPIYSTYEHVVISALRAAHEQDARSATNRNETSIGELRAAAFAISNRLSHRLMTGVLGLLRNLGGSTVRVTRGDTLRERARVFFARHGPWLCSWEERNIELKDPAGILSPHRRRVRIWVRTHVDEAIAAHLERHGRVGVNVLMHPSDPEPAYNHHQDARFIARDTGPAVVGAPFKGSFCTGLVAAVTAAVHARHPDRAHEPAVVVPLAMSLDMAAVSTQQSGAMLFLQPHNYVGPFARSTNALIPVAVVGALDLGAVGSAASLRAIKRDFMQQVWHEAVGRAIMDNHAAGGTPVGPIGGGGPAIVRRMLIADGVRVQDQLAQASECSVFSNHCMICSMRPGDFAHPERGSDAAAAAQLRDPAAVRDLRATLSSPDEPAATRRAAAASLQALGAQPEPPWVERLVYTNAEGDLEPLWEGCHTAPRRSFREPLHQELLGLVAQTHHCLLKAIKLDMAERGLTGKGRTRVLQVLDARARGARPAFNDGATEPVTAVVQLSSAAMYTGDRRFDALFALSAALSSDACVIADERVLQRLQRAINALIATIEMERPFQFSQRQLDAYVESQRIAADAFVAAFKNKKLMPSKCNTTKVHAARCHRRLECLEGGAPAMRTAQHFEAANSSMVASFQASNKQSLAGLAARASDEMAAQVISDMLGVDDGTLTTRPLGAAASVLHYPPIQPVRSFTISASALKRVPVAALPTAGDGDDSDDDSDDDGELDALCKWAARQPGHADFDPRSADIHVARTASVVIPGRVKRPRLTCASPDGRKPVYAILGPTAAGEPLRLRRLRVARVTGFYQLQLGEHVKTLAVATDLVTCTAGSTVPADRVQARFCRDFAFAMVPLRTALPGDVEAGRARRLRVLDFAAPGDVLQLGHVLARAITKRGVKGSASACSGDYFLCIAKLLAGATRQPFDEGPADWLPET
jgi:hypothetical protein